MTHSWIVFIWQNENSPYARPLEEKDKSTAPKVAPTSVPQVSSEHFSEASQDPNPSEVESKVEASQSPTKGISPEHKPNEPAH